MIMKDMETLNSNRNENIYFVTFHNSFEKSLILKWKIKFECEWYDGTVNELHVFDAVYMLLSALKQRVCLFFLLFTAWAYCPQ